jgi:hypothetical protein
MPQFESFDLTYLDSSGASHTVAFEARQPAGATEPARWATHEMISGWMNRLGDTKLSFRIKRNQADTADQVQLNMVMPQQCNQTGSCVGQVVDKSILNFYMVIPDTLDLADRRAMVEAIAYLLLNNNFKSAIINGSNYY